MKTDRNELLALGDEIHNLGTKHQNDEELSATLGAIAVRLWKLAAKYKG